VPPPTPTTEPTAERPGRLAEPDLAALRVIPLRHPGRWIATIAVLVVLAQFVHGLVTNPFYQWDRFAYWFFRPVVLEGLLVTLQVTGLSAVFALLGGIALALARQSRSPVLQAVS
jgi:polar amino acid transport system permease protein